MSTTRGVYRVLIAEDDPPTLNLQISALTGAGYLVDYCENGKQALAMARTRSYALLITDLRMPVMGGDPLIRTLRAQGETLPALVISGSAPSEAEMLAQELEFVRFLAKPFSLDKLLEVIGEMAGKVRG